MNSLVRKLSPSGYENEIKRAHEELEAEGYSDSMWGSSAGFGNIGKGVPRFNLPAVPDVRFISIEYLSKELTRLLASGFPEIVHR